MWTRKELKTKAKIAFKRNYWPAVIVCFILALFAGAHNSFNSRLSPDEQVKSNFQAPTNTAIVNNFLDNFNDEGKPAESEAAGITATKGLFAAVFNNATRSGSFVFGTLNALNQTFFHDNIFAGVIIFLGALLSFLYWLLVGNILRVGECRFYLENRVYPGSKVERIIYLYKIRSVKNAAVIMLRRTVYICLWSLTVAGGFIKAYSYRMVPYIVAENPGVHSKAAFQLSRQMMHGNKWNAFVLDLSFILWDILNFCTFGLLALLFVNPYKTAVKAELYAVLRQNAIDGEFYYSEYLNDKYLVTPTGDQQYPKALFTIAEHEKSKWLTVDYHRNYSLPNLTIMFFIFSFVGWLWEVLLYLYTDGTFVNRGILLGPWLPVYGFGCIMILLLLKKFIGNPILTFFLCVVICAVVEYTTGWYMETFLGHKWWDYSGYMFNLQGRICLERLILFGLGGSVGIYLFAPLIDETFNKIPKGVKNIVCVLLVAVFAFDCVHSIKHPNVGEGITMPVAVSSVSFGNS